jgi:excisionase family DNA binding protein
VKAIETTPVGRTDTLMSVSDPIRWMGTREACERLGVTLRTLYRFIDEGQVPAYKMGRVIRLQAADIDAFIERMRIPPGSLEHLYPEPRASAGEQADAGAPSPVPDEHTTDEEP